MTLTDALRKMIPPSRVEATNKAVKIPTQTVLDRKKNRTLAEDSSKSMKTKNLKAEDDRTTKWLELREDKKAKLILSKCAETLISISISSNRNSNSNKTLLPRHPLALVPPMLSSYLLL